MGSLVPSFIAGTLVLLCGGLLWLPAFNRRDAQGPRRSWLAIVGYARWPMMTLAAIIAARVMMSGPIEGWTDHNRMIWLRASSILTTAAITTSLFFIMEGVERVVRVRFDMSVSDNLKARRLNTQMAILVRTVQVVILIIAGGIVLMSFDAARQFGASLLASAGIASLVVGLAARPVLENILAGVQIALTQPVRIDDVVVIDGEWGRIEEIASTYVVLRIWDDRRLIVPLRFFMDHPIENWTRTSSQLLGTVYISCDFDVDVDAVRAELSRLCESSEAWDRRVAIVQVTDASERSVQLRALVSASSGSKLWDLRTVVREGLVRFVSEQSPESLPRTRVEIGEIQMQFSDSPFRRSGNTKAEFQEEANR